MAAANDNTQTGRKPTKLSSAIQRMVTAAHTFLYRLSGGAIGGRMLNSPVLLLTTIGRKTGKQRTTPLLYLRDGENLVLVASNGGTPTHPTWWLNLRNRPEAEVQVKDKKLRITAEQASPEEKKRLWPSLVAMYPTFAKYQQRTSRDIPVIILRPVKDNRTK